jgi:hypothetical protein
MNMKKLILVFMVATIGLSSCYKSKTDPVVNLTNTSFEGDFTETNEKAIKLKFDFKPNGVLDVTYGAPFPGTIKGTWLYNSETGSVKLGWLYITASFETLAKVTESGKKIEGDVKITNFGIFRDGKLLIKKL